MLSKTDLQLFGYPIWIETPDHLPNGEGAHTRMVDAFEALIVSVLDDHNLVPPAIAAKYRPHPRRRERCVPGELVERRANVTVAPFEATP